MTTTTVLERPVLSAGIQFHLRRLCRVRWGVRATLALGVAASVTANILHARQNPISQGIAAWPPLALLLTVELISRVPVLRRSLGLLRIVATATIAGIAAWVSYWHMAGVTARYGETGASVYLLPFSVDGLIVVASISLVVLADQIRAAEAQPAPPVAVEIMQTVVPVPEPETVIEEPVAINEPALPEPIAEPVPTLPEPVIEPAPSIRKRRRPAAETVAAAAAVRLANPDLPNDAVAARIGTTGRNLRERRRRVAKAEELIAA